CPGRYMYNRLGEMRTRISSYLGSFADRQPDRDLDGDGRADFVVTNGSVVSIASTVERGTWTTQTIGAGWRRTVSPGDFNGDGRPDLIHIDASGYMWLFPGKSVQGEPVSATRVRIGSGWNSADLVIGGADW